MLSRAHVVLHRLSRFAIALAPTAAALIACSSSADKLQQADTNLRSWDATVRTVSDQWAQGRAPTGYTTVALDRAAQGIQQELAAVPSSAASDPVRARGRDLLARVDALRAAVERHDSAAVRAALVQ